MSAVQTCRFKQARRRRAVRSVLGCAALAATCLTNAALAVDTTYTGPAAGNWDTADNWNGGVPTNTSHAFIDSGNVQDSVVTIGPSLTRSVATLSISAGDQLAISNASILQLVGDGTNSTLSNAGVISIDATANATRLRLALSGIGTLSGGGSINLTGIAFIDAPSSATLFNLDNTISGEGSIGNNTLAVTNQGLIQANVTGSMLTLDPPASGMQNSGVLLATNGGILRLSGGTFTNTGTIQANADSTVSLSSATITGGTLATSGTGVIETIASGNGTLVNVTNTGHYVGRNNSDTFISGTITNSGSISLISGANVTDLETAGGSTVTLTGGGVVNLGGTNARILGNGTLHNLNNTIRGQGTVGVNAIAVVNAGTIAADVNTATLTLDVNADGLSNSGSILATNGGILSLTGSNVANSGTFLAANGSTISLSTSTITGGTLATSGTGVIETLASGSGTLANVTNTGHYVGRNNSDTFISGTITNSGSISLISGANNADLETAGGETVTLTGGGVVNLDTANSRILGNGTLHNLNNTIRGRGSVGVNVIAIVNAGTISADVSGATLTIDASANGLTNSGTILAANGGILSLSGSNVTNSGTFLAANGSTISLSTSTITGGTLATTGTGVIETTTSGSGTLANVTNTGHYVGRNNSDTFISGTITNNGSISLIPVANVTDLETAGGSTVTLTGGGVVNLDGATARILGSATLVTSTHIRGVGAIGVNSLPIINSGIIEAAPVGTVTLLTIDPPASGFVNTGTLLASAGAQLVLTGGTFSGGGNLAASAGGSLNTQASSFVDAGAVSLDGAWNNSSALVTIANVRGAGSLNITAGTVSVNANGGTMGTSRIGSLSITGTGRFNLTDNDLVIDYTGDSPLAAVRALLLSAYAGGAWTGVGLTSSVAASASPKTALGYLDNISGSVTSFSGQTVDDTSILIKYTYVGDADLNGQVDVADLGRLASNWQTAASWSGGDFDYSGFVDVADLGLLASNWQVGVGNPLGPSFAEALAAIGLGPASVPEPHCAALVGIAMALKRRRR